VLINAFIRKLLYTIRIWMSQIRILICFLVLSSSSHRSYFRSSCSMIPIHSEPILKWAMTPWNCEKLEKQKKMYTMFVASSVLCFQSSRRTRAKAPTVVSAPRTSTVRHTISFEVKIPSFHIRVALPQKNQRIVLRLITSSNIDWFSNFFPLSESGENVTKDPTTSQMCHYTTLSNVSVLKATTENKTTSVTTH